MKNLIGFLFTIVLSFIISCGDSDVVQQTKTGEISATNIKRLDKNTEGVYGVWVSVVTSADHGDEEYRSVGRFNISSTGSLVDTSVNENPFSLNLGGITNINAIEDAIITIEPPGDNDTVPSNTRFIGGAKSTQGSSLVFSLSMEYSEVLGSIASQFSNSAASCVLSSPTTGDTNLFNRGIWFSQNINGTAPGLTLPAMPDTLDWIYQAWVIDTRDSTNRIYNMGRFGFPNQPDNYQQCQQNPPASVWELPGQDWMQLNCPGVIPDITYLNSGFYKVLITLEPRFEQGLAIQNPFYIRLFYGSIMPSVYGTVLTVPNSVNGTMPSSTIRLSLSN